MKYLNLLKHFCFLPFKLVTIFLLLILITCKQILYNPFDVIIIPQNLINFLIKILIKK